MPSIYLSGKTSQNPGNAVRKYTPSTVALRLGIVVLTCLFLGLGCGRAVNRSAERRIREALPDLIGPATRYQVHVEGAAERTLSGELARVTIDGDNIEASNGLLLDHLHLTLEGVRYDTDRKELQSIRSAHFEGRISENTLDEYFAGESPLGEKIRKIRVTFGSGNQVDVSAERVTLGVGIPFKVSGPLYVRETGGGAGVEIDPIRLVVVNIPIMGVVLRFVLERFANIGSLSTLPFPVHIEQVRTEPGAMTMTGTADVAAILQRTAHSKRKQK